MKGISHPDVDRGFIIHLYRQIIERAKGMGLALVHYDIYGRELLLNKIFGSDTEIEIDGRVVRLIRDDTIAERNAGNDTFQSELYLVDREQLKANQEESERYGLGLLIA